MNPMERVITALGHREPDRVPLFLLLSTYGAKEAEVQVKEYFSDPTLLANTQLKMQKKYDIDCLYSFFYAALEIEAFGGEAIFSDDSSPNSGEPIIKKIEQIKTLEPPSVRDSKALRRVLKATELLKKEVGDSIPILGVVMSPFSLPVMQMGFENYLELLYFREKEFEHLMTINQEFCVTWANEQLNAGATAITYFDPLASPTIIEKEKYLKTGHKIAKNTIPKIKGFVATHLASGISLPVLDEIVDTGAVMLGFSGKDNLEEIKEKSRDKICLLGNLNGVDMVNWDVARARHEVKCLIEAAAPGGGFILSDNHGEIPLQVHEDTLFEISETIKKYGTYPIHSE